MRVEDGVTEALVATPAGEQRFHFPFTEAHNLDQRPGRDRRRRRARRPLAEMADRAAEHRLLPLPRRAPRARRRNRPRERLLQRQPGVDARGARPPRDASSAGRADRGARRDGRARPGRGRPTTARSASTPARAGVDLLIGVGEPARDYDPDELVADPEEAAELLAAAARARRRGPGQGLALGRPRGGRREAAGARWRLAMGEVLIAGHGGDADLHLPRARSSSSTCGSRSSGSTSARTGPQEHHAKAGTPTMGGLIVFASICVPYLVLSDRDAQSLAVFGVAIGCAALGFADDFIKIVKRRSLGLSARWKLLFQLVLALGLWWVARHEVGLEPILDFRIGDASLDLGPVLYFVLVFLVIAGTSQRRQPHRRPRRPRRRLLRDRPARLHGDRLRHQRAAEPGAALGLPGRRLHRLPLVQRLPGLDLHGGHRLAGPGRRDRRAGGDDPDRGPADHHRRDLRDRGALGRRSRSSPSRPSAAASC